MLRAARLTALSLLTVGLYGCAVDSNISYVPDVMKQAAPQPAVHQAPDVGALLKTNVNAVFAQGSSPTGVRFSPPVAGKYGGWDTCVKGEVVGVTGQPLGMQTFLVTIDNDRIGRRERVGPEHWCARQTYTPL
jgi:hypothetical protein